MRGGENEVSLNGKKLSDKAENNLSNVTAVRTSSACTINGVSGTKHLGKHLCIESWRSDDGNSWYRLYDDGWKECGGNFSTPNQQTAALEIKLPLTFINTPVINVQYIRNITQEDSVYYGWITEKNTSSFKYYTYWSTNGNISIDYCCCGY